MPACSSQPPWPCTSNWYSSAYLGDQDNDAGRLRAGPTASTTPMRCEPVGRPVFSTVWSRRLHTGHFPAQLSLGPRANCSRELLARAAGVHGKARHHANADGLVPPAAPPIAVGDHGAGRQRPHSVVSVCRKMDVRSPSPSASTKACTMSSRPYLKMPGRRFPTGWTAPPMWQRPPISPSRVSPTPRRCGSSLKPTPGSQLALFATYSSRHRWGDARRDATPGYATSYDAVRPLTAPGWRYR